MLYEITAAQYIATMRCLPILFACLVLTTPPSVSAADAFDVGSVNARRGSIAELVVRGLSYVGIPYRLGGHSRDTGLDCSALIQQVYREALGFVIPRTTREQARLGQRVDLSRLKAGDLVFFSTRRRAYSHVGLYLGDDRFLHAPSSGGEVRVEPLRKRYWVKRFSGGRRLVPQPVPVSDVAFADAGPDIQAAIPADIPVDKKPPARAEIPAHIYTP